MRTFLHTLRFLWALNNKKTEGKAPQSIRLARGGFSTEADVYSPVKAKQHQGTIVFIHGMTLSGHKDPRIIALCRAAERAGYLAIAPHFPKIACCEMNPVSVENIDQVIHAIAEDPSLSQGSRVAVFTASFSGLLGLCAVSRLKTAPLVNHFCAVGSSFDPETVCLSVLDRPDADKGVKWVLLKNFLPDEDIKDARIYRGLELAAEEAFNRQPYTRFHDYLKAMDTVVRQRLLELYQQVQENRPMGDLCAAKVAQFAHQLLTDANLNQLDCRVFLLHSTDDNIIASAESVKLYQQLQALSIPSDLLVTPLLKHADVKITLGTFLEIFKMMKIFHYYLADLNTDISITPQEEPMAN